jgi:hypothetical protein
MPTPAGSICQVRPGGASWILRYGLAGRTRYMGVGPLTLYGLADARTRAVDARRLRHEGIDPIDARKPPACAALDAAKATTFKVAAERYIAAPIRPLVDAAGGQWARRSHAGGAAPPNGEARLFLHRSLWKGTPASCDFTQIYLCRRSR